MAKYWKYWDSVKELEILDISVNFWKILEILGLGCQKTGNIEHMSKLLEILGHSKLLKILGLTT